MRSLLGRQLPPGEAAPGLARRALHDLPRRFWPLLPNLELLVSELVTNSVTHGELLPSDHIGLAVHDGGTYLRVEVLDPGRAYDDAQAGWRRVADDEGVDPRGQHGFGLGIVQEVADRAGVHWNMGTVGWFEVVVGSVRAA